MVVDFWQFLLVLPPWWQRQIDIQDLGIVCSNLLTPINSRSSTTTHVVLEALFLLFYLLINCIHLYYVEYIFYNITLTPDGGITIWS